MKHKTQPSTKEQGESLKNILYVWNGFTKNQKTVTVKMVETLGKDKIVLNHNQGKAPPGHSGGSGPGRGHPPENRGDPPAIKTKLFTNEMSMIRENTNRNNIFQSCEFHPTIKSKLYTDEFKHSNKNQNLNFYKLLIFTIMKKQILFLALFSLALIFAGIKSYGQVTYTKNLTGAPACTPALPLACAVENELQPLPGKVYTYTVNVGGGAPPANTKIEWFVTDQASIINGGGAAPVLQANRDAIGGKYVLTATAPYNNAANTSASVAISWKSFDGNTNQVLLVAYVTDAAGCTNNVEVYRIIPSFAFTLDIAGLLDSGAAGATECVSPVESATYTGGTDLTMNYGENWVFYSVNAANFVHSWQPAFTVVGYTGASGVAAVPVADIQWAYPADAQANTAWHPVADPVLAQVAGGAVGAAGECIVVRVRIDHGGDENDGGNAVLTFGVDGTMYDPAATNYANTALKDLDNVATAPCTNTVTDQATYTLTPRPAVTTATGTPLLNFEPKLP